MGIYEFSKTELNKYFQTCIEKSECEFELSSEEMTQIFLADIDSLDQLKNINHDSEINWPYNDGVTSQYLIPNSQYYIRVKDTVKDFIEKSLSASLPGLLSYLIDGDSIDPKKVIISVNAFLFLKNVIQKYIVKLDDDEYAIVLFLLRNMTKTQKQFTEDNIDLWLERTKFDYSREKVLTYVGRLRNKGVLDLKEECYSFNF